MAAGDKLDRVLAHLGIKLDHAVEVEGHAYQAWEKPDEDDVPHGAPYAFRTLRTGQRRLVVRTPDGEIKTGTGATNEAAIDALAKKLGLEGA